MVLKELLSYLDAQTDSRVRNWPFMKSIYPILSILVIYILLVKTILPIFMKNRKPFSLKKIIQVYNLFQVTSCILLLRELYVAGYFEHAYFTCMPIDYSNDPQAIRFAELVWWTMALKMCELIETIFFVLRKKYNQVSKLHLYHHVSTLLLAWCATRYIAGGMVIFPAILNTFIHVIMYSYYFASTLGPEWQKSLNKWKNKLTIMQMIQFCILLYHCTGALFSDCDVPTWAAMIFAPNVLLVFYMFYDFYQQNYTKKTKSE